MATNQTRNMIVNADTSCFAKYSQPSNDCHCIYSLRCIHFNVYTAQISSKLDYAIGLEMVIEREKESTANAWVLKESVGKAL